MGNINKFLFFIYARIKVLTPFRAKRNKKIKQKKGKKMVNINLKEYTANTAILEISDFDHISKKTLSITLYYSYKTLMGIKGTDNILFVSQNVDNESGKLSKTTGSFLNSLEPNKDNRYKREIFEKLAGKIVNQLIFNL